MVLKWARFGPDEKIDTSGDFTRLTLDSIAMYDAYDSYPVTLTDFNTV